MNQTSPPPAVPEAQPIQPVVRIVFYCKDCETLVDGIKVGRKYVYRCPVCGTKNVAFGTEKSIRSFYHVEDAPAASVKATPAPVKKVEVAAK